VSFTELKKMERGMNRKIKCLRCIELELFLRHLSGEVTQAAGYASLELLAEA
jgi:hypothetical protein